MFSNSLLHKITTIVSWWSWHKDLGIRAHIDAGVARGVQPVHGVQPQLCVLPVRGDEPAVPRGVAGTALLLPRRAQTDDGRHQWPAGHHPASR